MRKPNAKKAAAAVKAAKTRKKNARLRASLVARSEARQSETEAKLAERSAIDAKRAKAYSEMEPYVCNLARAGEMAMFVSDEPNLFLFAVEQFEVMAQRFRKLYYATEFPPE